MKIDISIYEDLKDDNLLDIVGDIEELLEDKYDIGDFFVSTHEGEEYESGEIPL